MDKPQIIPHLESSVDFTLFDCSWVPCSARFVVVGSKVSGRGVLRVYTMGAKELTSVAEATTAKAIKCATFGASSLEERHLATGDFAGNLALWDLEDTSKPILSVQAHEDLINAIDGAGGLGLGQSAPEIATASRDGKIKVWDVRCCGERPVACVQPAQPDMKRDAWAVAFGHCHTQSDRMLVSGYDNGDVKMFDLRMLDAGPHWETELPTGVCSLQFDRKDIDMNKLLATCLEGQFHVWDLRTKSKTKGFASLKQQQEKGERSTLWCGRHLPQDRDVFLTAAGSGELALWKYEYPEKRSKEGEDGAGLEGVAGTVRMLQECQLGDQPVGSFCWSTDKTGLGLCISFDQKIRTLIVTKLNLL